MIAPPREWIGVGLIIGTAIYAADAGHCSPARRCDGLSERLCRDSYGCRTYETPSSIQSPFGNFDTITSFASLRCTDSSFQGCSSDFETEYMCNRESSCKWIDDGGGEGDEGNGILVGPACPSVGIDSGCEDTYMGSIAGVYKPIKGASCSGRPVYTDGSRKMVYDKSRQYWKVGVLCNENSCDCLPPSYATFEGLDDARVSCYDGGYGSSKSWDYTDLAVRCEDGGGGSGRGDGRGGVGGPDHNSSGGGGGGGGNSAGTESFTSAAYGPGGSDNDANDNDSVDGSSGASVSSSAHNPDGEGGPDHVASTSSANNNVGVAVGVAFAFVAVGIAAAALFVLKQKRNASTAADGTNKEDGNTNAKPSGNEKGPRREGGSQPASDDDKRIEDSTDEEFGNSTRDVMPVPTKKTVTTTTLLDGTRKVVTTITLSHNSTQTTTEIIPPLPN